MDNVLLAEEHKTHEQLARYFPDQVRTHSLKVVRLDEIVEIVPE